MQEASLAAVVVVTEAVVDYLVLGGVVASDAVVDPPRRSFHGTDFEDPMRSEHLEEAVVHREVPRESESIGGLVKRSQRRERAECVQTLLRRAGLILTVVRAQSEEEGV